jgi:hypothetical protein
LRANSAWKPASLTPNVVGSAWMPWLRPMVGVILCSKARFFSAASTRSTPLSRRSLARCQLHGEAGVEHVGRGHALVEEAGFIADVFGNRSQEGDDVVLHFALDLVDAVDIESSFCWKSR